MATNNFLPFASTDTGTNLLPQADYSVAADRINGNQPGVASSKLVNKAIRQSAFVTSQLAQYLSDKTGGDLLDDANNAKLLAQINAAILPLAPSLTNYLTAGASGIHYVSYWFFIATGSATAAATYTNNSFTFTVKTTVASGVMIQMTGTGAPTVSGTLTKSGGTGDATLTFYARRAPVWLNVRMAGGGGGGGGSTSGAANNGGTGGTGGTTSFGSSLLSCTGGNGGNTVGVNNGSGGSTSVSAPAVTIVAQNGGIGGAGTIAGIAAGELYIPSGAGGSNPFSGGGSSAFNSTGITAVSATGCGGSGGGSPNAAVINSCKAGPGGGAGAYIEALIPSPAASYAYAVGIVGTAGTAGTSGFAGGAGSGGVILVAEYYQ